MESCAGGVVRCQLLLLLLLVGLTDRLVDCFNMELDKVVLHRPSYLANANFGFSVAGYKVDNDSWILVGAPLASKERSGLLTGAANAGRSREGAIYRCRINVPNSCYMLPFDKKGELAHVTLNRTQALNL